jgi:predicted nucleic acid-binding Zn ribbon protein
MRRSNTQPLSDILREYIGELKIERKLKEVDVIGAWEPLLGKTIARYTRNLRISNRILYVEISSSVVKNELIMMREEICRKLNESVGGDVIERIVFK